MASRKGNATMRPGFCAAIVLTTPPFPYDREIRRGSHRRTTRDVRLAGSVSKIEKHLYYGEVGVVNGQLVTAGMYGWTMVATAVADNIDEARRKAGELADRVIVPNMRYRRDIGSKLSDGDFAVVEALSLLDAIA